MIYSESSITRSDLIQSNLQTSMDDQSLFNYDHPIILSCTKSVMVLFERDKSNRLKPQDVTYNGQVIPLTLLSSSDLTSVLSPLLLLKLNSIFSSTYGPSTSILIRLYKSYIRSLLDYGAPAICVASPDIQLIWESIQTRAHFPFHPSSTTTETGSTLSFHPFMTETCT